MRLLKGFLLSVLAVFLLVSSSRSDWLTSPTKGKRGWYGYEPLKKEKKRSEGKKKKKKVSVSVSWPTPDELYRMKVSEIRKWINRAADEAISNPTEKNIKRWIEYMHVADRKASEFSGMWAWVMQKNPDLYREAALYPSVNPGMRAYWKSVWDDIRRTLRRYAESYALLFFRSDDPFSKAQDGILGLFREQNPDWIVKTVWVNPEISRRFHISYVPQIWLLSKKTKKPIPLAAGVVSESEIEKRIYHTILVLEGVLPPQLSPYEPFRVGGVNESRIR